MNFASMDIFWILKVLTARLCKVNCKTLYDKGMVYVWSRFAKILCFYICIYVCMNPCIYVSMYLSMSC